MSEQSKAAQNRKLIISVIDKHGGPMTAGEIRNHTNLKAQEVQNVLSICKNSGALITPGYKEPPPGKSRPFLMYDLPGRSTPMANSERPARQHEPSHKTANLSHAPFRERKVTLLREYLTKAGDIQRDILLGILSDYGVTH